MGKLYDRATFLIVSEQVLYSRRLKKYLSEAFIGSEIHTYNTYDDLLISINEENPKRQYVAFVDVWPGGKIKGYELNKILLAYFPSITIISLSFCRALNMEALANGAHHMCLIGEEETFLASGFRETIASCQS